MSAPPSCPRCGYDLSGAIATWRGTCPLTGLCTECGLTFEYRMVLNEKLRRQARFFEVAMNSLLKSCALTARRALFPWRFWRWVMMEHEINFERMAAGVGLGALCSLLRVLLVALVAAGVQLLDGNGTTVMGGGYAYDRFFGTVLRFFVPFMYDRGWGGPELDAGICTMLVLGLLVGGVTPFTFLLLPQTLRKAKVRRAHLARIAAWWFVGLPLVIAFPTVIYALIEFLEWLAELTVGSGYSLDLLYEYEPLQDLVTLVSLLVWTAVWWRSAIGSYLRLPGPWAITLAMLTIAFLVSFGLCLVEPNLRYHLALRF